MECKWCGQEWGIETHWGTCPHRKRDVPLSVSYSGRKPMHIPLEEILSIVLREMRAIGAGWRLDWSDFDGRTLRNQLGQLAAWAEDALAGEPDTESDYNQGTTFERERGE